VPEKTLLAPIHNAQHCLGIFMLNSGESVMKTLLATLLASSLLFGMTNVLAEKKSTLVEKNQASGAFKQKFKLHGISFQVTSQGNKLRIVPSGLKIDNSPIERDIDGTVTGADIGDINVDRSPEIYVYVKDAKGRTSLIAYSANKNKSLSEIFLPLFTDDPKLTKGYRWHDEIAMVEGIVALRFPIYKDGDTDDKPTGGTRQLQYKLTQGEASWVLKLNKVLEF
jgi:hypothetical protein